MKYIRMKYIRMKTTKSLYIEDDFDPDPIPFMTITVLESDDTIEPTGILDINGDMIGRVSDRIDIGFHRP